MYTISYYRDIYAMQLEVFLIFCVSYKITSLEAYCCDVAASSRAGQSGS